MLRARLSELMGKTIVSEEKGRKFGEISDISYIVETGELLNILMAAPTKYAKELKLEEDKNGRLMVPFSSVKSIGDFIIISEEEII